VFRREPAPEDSSVQDRTLAALQAGSYCVPGDKSKVGAAAAPGV